jgi:hypothetical protein
MVCTNSSTHVYVLEYVHVYVPACAALENVRVYLSMLFVNV